MALRPFVRAGQLARRGDLGPEPAHQCSHDLDWLRHIVGRPSVRVSSVGGLHHFTAANRPEGAADRCLDCAVEAACPYSAKRLYLRRLQEFPGRWPLTVVTTDHSEAGVLAALREGPYGRCVYAGGNDVADHQVVTVEFEGGVTATLTMSAFTPMGRRRTRIMGTRGFLEGDGERLTVTDFVTGDAVAVEIPGSGGDAAGGHDGGDFGVMDAFVTAVATGDRSNIRSGPRESLESHLMAFAAEESRRTACAVPVWAD
ncbi:Gfo/Idh/MocA family oxidoreductase [Luedemannella flava]